MSKTKPDLEILITMMREFDYEKNGKNATISFLAQMIQYFMDCEFNETIET